MITRNSDFYIGCAYHGIRASILSSLTSLGAYKTWPDSWTWLILAIGAIAQAFNGIDSYLAQSAKKE